MTSRAWLDANALISLLAGTADSNHGRALGVFRRIADGELEVLLTAPVLCEVAWFLEQRLGWTRARCGRQLRSIVEARGVVVPDRAIARAIELFAADRHFDMVDAYLGACALTIGPPVVVSFDRDVDQVEGVSRIRS